MPSAHGLDEYLEAVYILEVEGISVIGARVADLLGVRAPSVTEALRRLEQRGMVVMDDHRTIVLTPQGWERAEGLIRRHRLAERWLTDVLALDWADADVEAHRLEHAFSQEVADRLSAMMGHPRTCPHGNPIPGNWPSPGFCGLSLDQVAPGEAVEVERLLEHAEVDQKLLKYLWQHQILPGTLVTMVEQLPGAGTLTVRRGQDEVVLGIRAASKIQVRPAGGD
ncbi:MAG: metal-dependent transcriptional regulator [Chloroflexi bacterium]|nr:metal-dependent transcriptional regulator [Chloroflexota bacterium]